MQESHRRDVFQIGLLILMSAILVINAILFLRLNRFQRETQAALQKLERVAEVEPQFEGLQPGDRAPSFTLRTLEQQRISLSDFSGSKLVLFFVATECGACERVYPILREMMKSHAGLQAVVVFDGPLEDIQTLATEEALFVPIGLWDKDVAQAYLVFGTPSFTVIDEHGLVSASGFVTTRQHMENVLTGP